MPPAIIAILSLVSPGCPGLIEVVSIFPASLCFAVASGAGSRPCGPAPLGHPNEQPASQPHERVRGRKSDFGSPGWSARSGGGETVSCGESPHPRMTGRPYPRRRRGGGSGRAGEALSDQRLEGSEVALGQGLEAPAASANRGVGGPELTDRPEQVVVVLAELQLDGPREARTPGQLEGGLLAVSTGLDQGPEAQSLEPLGDGAPIPAEGPRRRLHVEPV